MINRGELTLKAFLEQFMYDFDALEKLTDLRDRNALTQEEFEIEKRKLLEDQVLPTVANGSGKKYSFLMIASAIAFSGFGIAAYALFGTDPTETGVNSASDSSARTETAVVEPREPNDDSLFQVGRTLGDLKIAITTKLGRNPLLADTGDCELNSINLSSQGGMLVKNSGWVVTSEASTDGFDAVSFAGKVDRGTSGSCYVTDANVGLFRDGNLEAIIYGVSPRFQGVTSVNISPHGHLRLYGDVINYSTPIADVLIESNVISAVRLPAIERFCDGSVQVPNVRGQLIMEARNSIMGAGWRPVLAEESGYLEPLVEAGVVETQSCSGTGFGLCSFAYSHPTGPTLYVGSMGESPEISDYDVVCERD